MADDHNPLDPCAQMTRAQRLEYRFFLDQMKQFEWHLRWSIWDQRIVPDIWHRALEAEGQPPKTRVTIRLDEDLVKFFRKMGPGWQTTLNAVVRADNRASRALLAKLGFLETGQRQAFGAELLGYAACAEPAVARQSAA